MDVADAVLDRLSAGESWLVEVVGEPGIGNYRLVSEFSAHTEDAVFSSSADGRPSLNGTCPPARSLRFLNDYVGTLEPAWLNALDENTDGELASILRGPRSDRTKLSVLTAVRVLLRS
jgi:hypothetical protein